MRAQLILSALIAICSLASCSNETGEDFKVEIKEWKRFENKDLGFAGELPANWEVKERPGEMLVLSPQDEENDNFREYFSLNLSPIKGDLSKSLDSTAAYNMQEAEKSIDSFNVSQYDRVLFEDIECFETTYSGIVYDMKLIWHAVFFIKDGIFYTLLFNYEAKKEKAYRPIGFDFFNAFTFDLNAPPVKALPDLAPAQ